MAEVKNRRENLFVDKIPPLVRDPDKIVEEAVKEVSKSYRVNRTSYTDLKNSLGKPAIYYGDFEIPWGRDEHGNTIFKVKRLYMTPVNVTNESKIEFMSIYDYGKQVGDSVVVYPACMTFTASSGDTPTERIGAPYYFGGL